MSNATPFDATPLALDNIVKGSGDQIEGEMRPSCPTREGDADRTISLAYSDVTGSDDIMSPMVNEGTQVAQSRTTTGKKWLSKKERQRIKEEKQERFERNEAEGKEKRKDTREAVKEARRLEGLVAAGFCYTQALELLKTRNVRVIHRRNRPDLAATMKEKAYGPSDPIFSNFQHLGGHGSGAIYILGEDTHEVVAAIRISEVKDLKPTSGAKFQHIFSYFTRDKGFHPSVANNHAMIGGGMRAIGWRASMEQNQAFGTYVPHSSVDPSIWYNHTEGGKEIHRMFAESFRDMAPGLFENQQMERYDYSVPALGVDFQDEKNNHPYIFCSNLAYTYNGFENTGHVDNDVSTFTHGIGGNVAASTGEISSFQDGFEMSGGFFYSVEYGIIFDYEKIDGVVEQIWQGPVHVHATVAGTIPKGFTRFGSSTQINKRLTARVRNFFMSGKGKVVGDKEILEQRM